MVEKRTIVEVILVIALLASMGVNITYEDAADNIYSCNIKEVNDMYCHKLSKVNDFGIQRNCYYNPDSPRKYKVCLVGWEKITLEETLKKTSVVIDKPDSTQWLCNPQGCEALI